MTLRILGLYRRRWILSIGLSMCKHLSMVQLLLRYPIVKLLGAATRRRRQEKKVSRLSELAAFVCRSADFPCPSLPVCGCIINLKPVLLFLPLHLQMMMTEINLIHKKHADILLCSSWTKHTVRWTKRTN